MGAYTYSATAASNTTIDGIGNNGAVDPPSNHDNITRALAASQAALVRDLGGANTVAGTADAIMVALADATAATAYFDGMIFSFRAASDSTSTAPTLNVDSIGAKTIKKAIAGVESALTAGDIQAGGTYIVVYRSAWASAAGAFELLNPYTVGNLIPAANATYDIGTTSLGINDLHFGSTGGVVNFNNGDVTITHASGSLTVAGGNIYVNVADGAPNNNTGNNPAGAFLESCIIDTAAYQSQVMFLNRLGNDGTIISFRQDGTEEGVISVSTTTVSLVGGHLARWTQWQGATPDPLPLRGTIVSNVDEMCKFWQVEYEWNGGTKRLEVFDDYTEGQQITITDPDGNEIQATVQLADNDQLNKMIVSNVAGDKNVAGVIDWYDEGFPVIAQSGDYVIRIAAGVTVARGDLLESNGDGCARPQADDIIRSKTVAKVSSTHVTETYPDGSYLVPCVLMAGG